MLYHVLLTNSFILVVEKTLPAEERSQSCHNGLYHYLIESNCVSFLFILPVVGKFDAFHLVIATRSVVPFFLYSGNVVFPCRRGTSVNILHHNTRNPNAHCTPQLHGLSTLTSIKRNQWILNQHSFCWVMRGKRLTAEQARNKAPRKIIRGTQRGYSSKPLKHSIVKRILVFKR